MIDAPGPWGTGPFILTEGYSSIATACAIQRSRPFACTWLIEGEDRADRVVLEANHEHWNAERRPRVGRVVFRNELTAPEALDLCLTTEGEVDIVTEVSPGDAARVAASEHAELVPCDANRVLVGVINRHPRDVPLDDRRARQALNLAVDRDRLVRETLGGHANLLPCLTAPWCGGFPAGAEPYPHDPPRARSLLAEAGWPADRPLVLATPGDLAPVAEAIAQDVRAALDAGCRVEVIPAEGMLAGARMLVEKRLPPPWDVLLHAWFDLSSEVPPAAVHREFFGADGAFRAGPEDPGFDRLFAELVARTAPAEMARIAERIDRYAFDEALALFLCAPKGLYAVNRHVRFTPYRTTFELAEAEVGDGHWSRRHG